MSSERRFGILLLLTLHLCLLCSCYKMRVDSAEKRRSLIIFLEAQRKGAKKAHNAAELHNL